MSSTSLMAKQTRIITEHLPSAPFPAIPCTKTPSSNSIAVSGDTGVPGGAAIEGNTFYQLSQNASRLIVWDVTNPAAMNKVGDQLLNAGAFAVNQKGTTAIGVKSNIAYVVNYDTVANCFLAAYDCTVPGAISQAGTFLLGAGTNNSGAQRVGISVVGGDTFCFVGFGDIINVVKVTNPAAMVSVATVTVPDVATNGSDGVFVFNNVLYATTLGLATHDFRAKAWDVSTPSAPVLKWDTAITFPSPATLPDIYVVNQSGRPIAVVLVQDTHGGLQTIDASNGAILGTLNFTSLAVAVTGQIWIDPTGSCCEVMLNNGATLRLCDIGNPAAPVVKSNLFLGLQWSTVTGLSSGTPTSIFCAGNPGGGNANLEVNSVNV